MLSDRPTHGIRSQAAWGVMWAIATTVGAKGVSLLSVALLARLLAPQDFGLLAFALAYITYFDTLTDLGTGMALIYWPEPNDDAAQVTFVITLVMGALLFGLTIVLAPAVAGFFHSPSGTPILWALAWSFPIRALGVTHDALCQKALQFRTRLVPEVMLTAVKGAMSIGLALAGLGVWSLVYGQLAGLATWTLVLWVMVPWRPAWRWPSDLLRPMLGYGRSIVAVNVLAAITHHADLVVVGRVLGIATLGFYQIANKIPDVLIELLIRAPTKVVFPAFASLHGQGRTLGEAYLTVLKYVALAAVPACTALAVLAEPLVLTAFGGAWRSSIPILRVLACYTCLRALGNHAGDVMKATGRAGLLARLAVGKMALLIPVLLISSAAGPTGVASGMTSVAAVAMTVDLLIVSRLTGVGARALIAEVTPAVVVASAVSAALVMWHAAWPGVNPLFELVGAVAVAVIVYVLVVRLMVPDLWRLGVERLRRSAGTRQGRLVMDVPR